MILPFKTFLDSKASLWEGKSENIHLTFDDGPNINVTPYILKILKEYNQKATFFLIPEYMTDETEYIIKRIITEGHTIGLHGKSKLFAISSIKYMNKYIEMFNRTISTILGGEFTARLFRPPSLWRSQRLYSVLNSSKITLIGVSPFCWLDQWTKNKETILKRFMKTLTSGKIFVLHDGTSNQYNPEKPETMKATHEILRILSEKNIRSTSL